MYLVVCSSDVFVFGFVFRSFNCLSNALDYCAFFELFCSLNQFKGSYKIYQCCESDSVSFDSFLSSLNEVEV